LQLVSPWLPVVCRSSGNRLGSFVPCSFPHALAAAPLSLKVQDITSKAGARERPRAAERLLKEIVALEGPAASNNKLKHNKDLEVVLEEKTDTEVI
jgi:hypothetical protein